MTKNPTKQKKRVARLLVPLAVVLGMLMAPTAPAFAGGYCVGAYPQPDTGATVCTPWG